MGEAHRKTRPRMQTARYRGGQRLGDAAHVVMSDEMVRVGALEDDDLQRVGGLDTRNKLLQFPDRVRIQKVEGRVVEDYAPEARRLLTAIQLPGLHHTFSSYFVLL